MSKKIDLSTPSSAAGPVQGPEEKETPPKEKIPIGIGATPDTLEATPSQEEQENPQNIARPSSVILPSLRDYFRKLYESVFTSPSFQKEAKDVEKKETLPLAAKPTFFLGDLEKPAVEMPRILPNFIGKNPFSLTEKEVPLKTPLLPLTQVQAKLSPSPFLLSVEQTQNIRRLFEKQPSLPKDALFSLSEKVLQEKVHPFAILQAVIQGSEENPSSKELLFSLSDLVQTKTNQETVTNSIRAPSADTLFKAFEIAHKENQILPFLPEFAKTFSLDLPKLTTYVENGNWVEFIEHVISNSVTTKAAEISTSLAFSITPFVIPHVAAQPNVIVTALPLQTPFTSTVASKNRKKKKKEKEDPEKEEKSS